VVAITAHAMVGDRETAIAAGCAECLTKPYELDELIALVERYIGPAQAQKKIA
jgi:CheY-like chemotaxis protein